MEGIYVCNSLERLPFSCVTCQEEILGESEVQWSEELEV